ncbi:hypothetical protein [Mycolicibacterium helvum]|uniref:Secreted protein n=1 Tax=Mycolicibacterium helvum TaxID=1534349 RepID=A0A7I7TCC8_9MYCO|nr:hypothetical protein [Mycolicibacterium helvum]BBY65806.1 hypothetical protein MHEL_40490 [Mycolicibacterium helvum]
MKRTYCAVAALMMALGNAGPAHADPAGTENPPDPFPDIRYYDQVDTGGFVQPGGVWFTAPTGQNCGIWGLGSFGCAGDIPGAPAGVSHIGWIDGDRAVHYDWSMAVRFPASQAQQPLPPRSKITHQGTTCAATPDGRTYCERGPMRFILAPSQTWLSAPWMDLSWIQLGPASCAPPDGGPCYS